MTDLESLCAELICADDTRAEVAAARFPEFGLAGMHALRLLSHSQDINVRWWAVRALAGFENIDEVIVDLLAALEDAQSEVRQAAIMAFCHHPTVQSLDLLIRALGDPDSMTSRLASNALILLGSQATMALLDVLNLESHSARLGAARALSEIKDPRSIPGLMKALETNSGLTQYWASLGLEKMGVGMVYLNPE